MKLKENDKLSSVNGFVFDFIGTLASVNGYSLEDSERKLCQSIIDVGFRVEGECFLKSYAVAHEKYRVIRYEELVEVTNAVWISEALNSLGFETNPQDERIKTAVNMFFEDYIHSLELRPCVKKILAQVSVDRKLGLISNFTYAPVVYVGLRKLGINMFFDAVLVSEDVRWRKPNKSIFVEALRRLEVTAEETVYVGDSPLEDIKGAQAIGMKTVFVPSQFYSLDDLAKSGLEPDFIVRDVCGLPRILKDLVED